MFLPLYFPKLYLFDHVQGMHYAHFGKHYFLSWLDVMQRLDMFCYKYVPYPFLPFCVLRKVNITDCSPGSETICIFFWVCSLGTLGQFSLFLSLKCMAPDLARVDFYGFSFQWETHICET